MMTSGPCPHSWLGQHHDRHARRTRWVLALTIVMMVGEIAGGRWFGSMALMADGWHMGTHAAALGIAALAYRYARHHARDPRFTFGTGKVGELAGFASAISLGIAALLIGLESCERLLSPRPIGFRSAGAIAVLGLIVNLVSAALLHDGEAGHDHDHGDGHEDHHHDTNLRAAYVHVLADAFTSVLAIVGLLAGRFLGWVWMDPAMGLVGAAVIAHWSIGLARTAGRSLLDAHDDSQLERAIRARLLRAGEDSRVTDLHVWRLGPGYHALMVSLVSAAPLTPADYRERLNDLPSLSHVTIEVNPP
ncbi:MAG: CDF family Co(II)/Ni(II) efflux transporter DmeF [Steroidobacteraceae bacterium]